MCIFPGCRWRMASGWSPCPRGEDLLALSFIKVFWQLYRQCAQTYLGCHMPRIGLSSSLMASWRELYYTFRVELLIFNHIWEYFSTFSLLCHILSLMRLHFLKKRCVMEHIKIAGLAFFLIWILLATQAHHTTLILPIYLFWKRADNFRVTVFITLK